MELESVLCTANDIGGDFNLQLLSILYWYQNLPYWIHFVSSRAVSIVSKRHKQNTFVQTINGLVQKQIQ